MMDEVAWKTLAAEVARFGGIDLARSTLAEGASGLVNVELNEEAKNRGRDRVHMKRVPRS
jgi:hypothetical protein